MRRIFLSIVLALAASLRPEAAMQDRRFQDAELPGGAKLSYTILLPAPFDPNATYPGLLFLPGGTQNETSVEYGMSAFIDDEAIKRHWIVLSPVEPRDGKLLYEGHEAEVFALMDLIAGRYHLEGSRFHMAGFSNGGKTAFRLAAQHPERFLSLVGLPAFPPERSDFDQLDRLIHIPVTLFVGEKDDWVTVSRATFERLRKLGGEADLRVMPGDDHELRSLRGGEKIFAVLEKARPKLP